MLPNRLWVLDMIEANKVLFKIPVYQRNYDWSTEQCTKLFNDTITAFKRDKKHFIGTIVYIKGEQDTSTLSERLIIDGQQRITTLYIFIKALYDYAKETDDASLESDVEDYLFNRKCSQNLKLKLKPVKEDNTQLTYLMNDDFDDLDQYSNICINYNLFKKLISSFVNEENDVKDIVTGLKLLEIVEIILDKSQGDEPQRIFESINSTGLELSIADLIRNYLLMDDENQEVLYEKYWLKIEKEIGYHNLTDFFIQYLNSKMVERINSKNTYEKFKDYYEQNFNEHEAILKDMLKVSKYYAAFIGRKDNYNENITMYLNDFRLLDQSTMYPFLLNVFGDYDEGIIDDNTLEKILLFLRSYSVRRIICDVPSNSLKGLYKGLYSRIYKDNKTKEHYYSAMYDLFMSFKNQNVFISDEQFKKGLIYGQLYTKKAACKFILAKIENSSKEKLVVSNLTIEHLLPQKENSIVWKNEIGEDYDRVYDTYLHSLGNLTITGYNSELGTKSFAEKKEIIRNHSKCNILNNDILLAEKWNENSILNRAEKLAAIVLKIMSYEKIDSSVQKVEVNSFHDLDETFDVTSLKLTGFIFCDEMFSVTSFSDALNKFINLIYELEPETIRNMAAQKFKVTSSDRIYMSNDPNDLRRAKQISTTGIYFETNLSSPYMLIFIETIIENTSFEVSDFKYCVK